MTQPFPDDFHLTGWMGPSGVECDAPDLIIEGEIPADLNGVYYRNGPDPVHPPREGDKYHWFHGDGMIQRFEFANGRVSWKNRWVRTEKYELERAAGKSLFGVNRNPKTTDPSVANVHFNNANTHIIWHGDRLLALMEGTIAVELDPISLETLGNFDYDGKITGPITAHPKFDHRTGEMVFFGNQAKGFGSPYLRYNVADKHGNLIKEEMIKAPFASFVHDFLVTENYVIFPVFPLVFDMERAISKGVPMAWEPDKGTHLGVMPRNGSAKDVTWHTMDPRWSFHNMNAWEEAGKIKIDLCASNATLFAAKVDGSMASANEGVMPQLRRWTIDVHGTRNSIKEELLDDIICEFPRTDDRYMTQPYRHGFAAGKLNGSAVYNSIVHFDTHTGSRTVWSEEHYLMGEPVFAPRTDNAAEADGYLVVMAYSQATLLSEVLVFNATDIGAGPIGRARLPLRIPAGFHGSWVGA